MVISAISAASRITSLLAGISSISKDDPISGAKVRRAILMHTFDGQVDDHTHGLATCKKAAGDNSQSYNIGDKVRVQWITKRGYYEWADGTVTRQDPKGGTGYIVRIDSTKFIVDDKDKEDLWGRERIHPAPAPAALGPVGPAAAADGLAGLVAGLAGGAAGGDDDDAAILAKAKKQIKSPDQVHRNSLQLELQPELQPEWHL